MEMIKRLRNLDGEACDDETLGEMYGLLCRCVEAGMMNSLPPHNPHMFLDNIHSIIQRPLFDRAAEMQGSFIESFAWVQEELERRLTEAEKIVETPRAEQHTSSQYIEAMQKLLLDKFKIFPRFTLDYALTHNQRESYDSILKQGIPWYDNLDETIFEEWQGDVAEVREGMKLWHHIAMFQSMCDGHAGSVSILQVSGGDPSFNKWLGCEVGDESDLRDVDSLVIYNSDAFSRFYSRSDKISYNSGFIIDSWMEFIPYKKQAAGMVFHCDRPDNEAPQALLLAVHPQFNTVGVKKNWDMNNVIELLDSTRFMLMNRAVEPDHIYQDGQLSTVFPLLSTLRLFLRRSSFVLADFDEAVSSIFDYIVGGDIFRPKGL
jgi:hypothetical protein